MKNKGFTLIEMMGVLALIMILVAVSSVAVGKTLKTNKQKALQMKVANILQGTEDFILQKNIKLIPGVPMYFSVSAMEAAGIFEQGANDAIEEIRNLDTGVFYVEALKQPSGKIEYNILKATDFQNKVNVDGNDFYLIANQSSTVQAIEKEPININFKLQNPGVTPIYNIGVTKVTYTIEKEDGTIIVSNKTIKNLAVNKNGIYNFKINSGLEPGNYRLDLDLTSDVLSGKIVTADSISLVVSEVYQKPLICSADTIPNTWYKDNVALKINCKQDITDIKAASISYVGKRYLDGAKTIMESISGSKTGADIAANGDVTIIFGVEGIYELEISATLGSQTSNAVEQTIRIDKTAPTRIGDILPSGTEGDNGWYKSDVTIGQSLLTETQKQESDILSGFLYNTLSDTSVSGDTPGKIVTLKSYDAAGNASIPATKSIKIDKIAPTCTNSGGNAAWTTGSRTITGTCSGETATTSGCFGNISKLYDSEIETTTAGPGSIKDKAGNIRTCANDQVVKIDRTAPTFTVSGNGTGWTNSRTLTVTASDNGKSGLHTTAYSFDNGLTWQAGNSKPYTTTGTVYIKVRDAVGNVSNTQTEVITNIDNTPPQFTIITNPKNSVWSTSGITVNWTATDVGSGFASATNPSTSGPMEFSYNQSTANPTSISQPTTAGTTSWSSNSTWSVERKDNLYFRISDRAGNSTGWISAGTIWIDGTAPTCTNSGGSTEWTSSNVSIIGTCSGETSSTSGCNGNASQLFSSEIETTTAGPGSISDVAGNGRTCANDQTVKIDRTAPTFTVSGNATTWASSRTLSVTASDNNKSGLNTTAYSFDNGSTWQASNAKTFTANGTVYIKVRDVVGNVSAAQTVTITNVDASAPTFTTITNPKNNVWTNANFDISWTVSESGCGLSLFEYGYDTSHPFDSTVDLNTPNAIVQPTAGATSWSASSTWSSERNDPIYFRATDCAGNTSGWVAAGVVKIDKSTDIIAPVKYSGTGTSGMYGYTVDVNEKLANGDDGSGFKELYCIFDSTNTWPGPITNSHCKFGTKEAYPISVVPDQFGLNYSSSGRWTKMKIIDNAGNTDIEKCTYVGSSVSCTNESTWW